MAIHWTAPVWLWPLLLLLAAGAVLWTVRTYAQTRPRVTSRVTRILVGLRVAALLLLVLALAGPVLSRLNSFTRPAEVAVVVEDSGSLQIKDAAGDTVQDRWSVALAIAAGVDSTVGGLRPAVLPVVLRGNGLLPPSEFHLTDPVVGAPTNHGTDLNGLLQQAADRLAGRPVQATVLISDGQETVRHGGRQAGTEDGSAFFVVGVGDADGPPDRVLKDLRYPDTAYVGDQVEVTFAVDHRFLTPAGGETTPRRITARLMGEDGVVAEKTVTSAEKLVPFVMDFTPAGEGLQAYELAVDVLDNERFPANNKVSLALNVRRERARVLLLSGMPSWDVRFLAQAAALEQRVALAVVHPTSGGLVFADSLVPWREPAGPSGWLTWDAVVLTGWTGALASLDWSILGHAVDQGLGLMVLAGSSSGPGGGPVPVAPPGDLAAFLPVQVEGWRWLQGPAFVKEPRAAAGHPLLGGVGRQDALDELPPLRQVAMVKAGAGAEVLLRAALGPGAAAEAKHCLLAVAGRGQGRVVWFGGRSLWELAFWEHGEVPTAGADGQDSQAQAGRRLARNMLVWTAEGATESGLEFTGRQAFFQAGEPIRLGAQWRDMRGQAVAGRQLSLVLRGGVAPGDTLTERTFALHRSGMQPGLSEVELPPLASGRYTVQLVGGGDPPTMGRREELIVADNNIEMTQVRMDRRRLKQLAAQRGGRFYDGSEPAERRALLKDLAALDWQGDQVVRRHRLDIRAGWPLLVAVVVLLSLEWYLRRRHGLL